MHGQWGFRYGFVPPFGFWFRTGWRFPRRQEYLRMLEEYREELEAELQEVNREIEGLKKVKPSSEEEKD